MEEKPQEKNPIEKAQHGPSIWLTLTTTTLAIIQTLKPHTAIAAAGTAGAILLILALTEKREKTKTQPKKTVTHKRDIENIWKD